MASSSDDSSGDDRSGRLFGSALLGELQRHYLSDEPAYAAMRRERVSAALEQSRVDLLGTVLAAAIFALVLARVGHLYWAFGWYGGQIALSWHRWRLLGQMHGSGRTLRRLGWEASFSLGLAGLAYAATVTLMVPADDYLAQTVLLVGLAGISAAFLSAYALLLEAALTFLIAAVLPTGIFFALSGNPAGDVLGLACATFIVVMGAVTMRSNVRLSRGFLLQAENELLVQELARRNAEVEELNELLRGDILERERVADDLREAKDKAEQLAERLMLLSSQDGLTGIANRRQFDESLQREWSRCAREGKPLALVLCDIDHFKRYNDRYGHQAGDTCLKRVAKLLDSLTRRGGDLAARYGGEEFALLLPATETDNATRLAEKAREQIMNLGIEHEGGVDGQKVTASFGVTSLIPQPDLRPALLVRTADQALYEAKHGGRNRVVALSAFESAGSSRFA